MQVENLDGTGRIQIYLIATDRRDVDIGFRVDYWNIWGYGSKSWEIFASCRLGIGIGSFGEVWFRPGGIIWKIISPLGVHLGGISH
jgi:hypothetical protein